MPEINAPPEWLTTTEAAERLGVHPKTVTIWAREGRLRAYLTPGGHRRFRPEDVGALLKQERSA
jgi:excisionase family DNA binding protein